MGSQSIAVMADTGDPEAVFRMVDISIETFGAVDIVVANAAIRPRQAFLDISIEDWHRAININLGSAFTKACLYLTSDASSFVTGQVIHVNGGSLMLSAHLPSDGNL